MKALTLSDLRSARRNYGSDFEKGTLLHPRSAPSKHEGMAPETGGPGPPPMHRPHHAATYKKGSSADVGKSFFCTAYRRFFEQITSDGCHFSTGKSSRIRRDGAREASPLPHESVGARDAVAELQPGAGGSWNGSEGNLRSRQGSFTPSAHRGAQAELRFMKRGRPTVFKSAAAGAEIYETGREETFRAACIRAFEELLARPATKGTVSARAFS